MAGCLSVAAWLPKVVAGGAEGCDGEAESWLVHRCWVAAAGGGFWW